MAITAACDYAVIVIDYVSAFLNDKLPKNEIIYAQLPTGRKRARGQRHMVGLLRQSLKGLKQSARVWYYTATSYLQDVGIEVSRFDARLFVHRERCVFITLHVEDCLIISSTKEQAQWTKDQISSRFDIKDTTSAERYLGKQIKRDSNGIHISKPAYINGLLSQFGLEDAIATEIPMKTGIRIDYDNSNEGSDSSFSSTIYQQCIGSLQFLVSSTRPDVTFAINFLSRFNARSKQQAWAAVKRVLRYLTGTSDVRIRYTTGKDDNCYPYVFSNSDWAGSESSYKLTTGYVVMMSYVPVAWRSQRQSAVSKSIIEAEYMSAAKAAAEVVWLKDIVDIKPSS